MSGKPQLSAELLTDLAMLIAGPQSNGAISRLLGISDVSVGKYRREPARLAAAIEQQRTRRVPQLVPPADGSRPRCPRCASRNLFRDLDGAMACLPCGWVQPPATVLPHVADVEVR